MTVNVALVGLAPRDGETTLSPVTRATNYIYTPDSHGTQTFYLQTTGEDVDEYVVRLSAAGFENAEGMLTQSDLINTTIPSLEVTFRWTWNGAPDYNRVTPTLSIDSGTINYGSITREKPTGSNKNYTYQLSINNVVIQNAEEDAVITISYTSGNRTLKKTISINQLISNPNVTLTSN